MIDGGTICAQEYIFHSLEWIEAKYILLPLVRDNIFSMNNILIWSKVRVCHKDTLRIPNDVLCPSVNHVSQVTFTLYARALRGAIF